MIKLQGEETKNIEHGTMKINENETENIEGIISVLKRIIIDFSENYEAVNVKLDTLKAFLIESEKKRRISKWKT